MTRQQIQESNITIAMFMGIANIDKANYGFEWYEFVEGAGSDCYAHQMEYHSSWNWLMPVVEKIEQGNYGFKMCRKVVEIYFDDTKTVILKIKEKSRQESLYKAIVEFIKWYNTQQP